jgi:hypothetical protein
MIGDFGNLNKSQNFNYKEEKPRNKHICTEGMFSVLNNCCALMLI